MIPFHHTEKKIGAPRQNRTAITGLQNQCNAIILVGPVCLRLCYDLLNCFFVVQCTLNFCSVLGSSRFQHLGQLFYIHWTKSGLASLVFQWVVVCVKCWHSFSLLFGSLGSDRTNDIFINSEAQLPLCYEGIFCFAKFLNLTFLPLNVGVWLWQFGHKIFRFPIWLLRLLPSMCSSSKLNGFPL